MFITIRTAAVIGVFPCQSFPIPFVRDGTAYVFTGEKLLGNRWIMLLNEEGQEIWSLNKPDDVPEHHRFRRSRLLPMVFERLSGAVLGAGGRSAGGGVPQGECVEARYGDEHTGAAGKPGLVLGFFLLTLGGVLVLAWLAVRRWFRQDQRVRDAARSD